MKGLSTKWMHAQDELYPALRGPAKEMTVLGAALSDQTKEYEPMAVVQKGFVWQAKLVGTGPVLIVAKLGKAETRLDPAKATHSHPAPTP